MNLFVVRKYLDKVLHPVLTAIGHLPIHANQWTMIGAVLGLVGGVVFFYGYWWVGLALLLLRGLVERQILTSRRRSESSVVDLLETSRERV